MIVTADSGVVVVSPKADGVRLTKTPTSNGGDEYAVTFSDVAVADDDVLAGAERAPGQPAGARDARVRSPPAWWPGRCG